MNTISKCFSECNRGCQSWCGLYHVCWKDPSENIQLQLPAFFNIPQPTASKSENPPGVPSRAWGSTLTEIKSCGSQSNQNLTILYFRLGHRDATVPRTPPAEPKLMRKQLIPAQFCSECPHPPDGASGSSGKFQKLSKNEKCVNDLGDACLQDCKRWFYSL